METRPIHHGSSGLFIGASKLLFALMNAAPAELLHFLDHAALQPIGYGLDKTPVLRRLSSGFIHRLAKKNAGN